ncbi:MAG: 30S ribosomal protein S17 [Candidatus Aenigmarchaeota archaeon ex4484_56]|nr:MAG: 30S ribosomal protein S17 [Candidatus Aenigmarchaeota archaeon ex4484_56]
MVRDIGIDVGIPKETCQSADCPFHGNLKIRGKMLKGVVVSLKPKNSAIIEKKYLKYVPKYERYERRRKKICVHKPSCIKLDIGDVVEAVECRPISKTKRHVVIRKIK